MHVYIVYNLGDRAYTCDINREEDDVSSLVVGDGVFLEERYAIVVEAATSATPPYYVFQISCDGKTKKIERDRWGAIRQICRRGHTSRKQHPGTRNTEAKFCAPVLQVDDDKEEPRYKVHAITALPIYAQKSFEELRLEDYFARGQTKPSTRWGGSDINKFLEVDLSSKKVILRRPPLRSDGTQMFDNSQTLCIIKNTTVKGSRERIDLIQFLVGNKLFSSKTAAYNLLKRDEKKLSVNNLEKQPHWKQNELVSWDSSKHSSEKKLNCLSPNKDRVLINDKNGKFKVFETEGWRGTMRLRVEPINFHQLGRREVGMPRRPLDICKFIGSSDLHSNIEDQKRRVCRLYFDRNKYPPPSNLIDGGSNATFIQLRNYIRSAASRDGSPVVCNGGKKGECKIFICENKKGKGKEKKCPFSFQVRWDSSGYYIHLLHLNKKGIPGRYTSCGVPWHWCKSK